MIVFMKNCFTTDEIFFTKLCERFKVPKTISSNDKKQIKQKVAKVMEQWLNTSGYSLSDTLRESISSFIQTNAKLFPNSAEILSCLKDPDV